MRSRPLSFGVYSSRADAKLTLEKPMPAIRTAAPTVKRSRRSAWFVAIVLALGCSQPIPPDPQLPPAPNRSTTRTAIISFVGLNDLHGRLIALPAFAGYVSALRRERAMDGGAVVVVDAGDIFQGTLESNSVEGSAAVDAYNRIGVNAVALGNHEFDFGPSGPEGLEGQNAKGDPQGAIKARIAEARFEVLSANLIDTATHQLPRWPKLRASTTLDVLGVKIGLIGVLTSATPLIVARRWFSGLDVIPLAPVIEEQARALRRDGARIVVVLAHAGGECTGFDDPHDTSSCDDGEIFSVAKRIKPGLVDAIFAGHTHTGIAHFVNGIAIVQAFSSGRAFARIDFVVDTKTDKLLAVEPLRPHALCAAPQADSCSTSTYHGIRVEPDAGVEAAIRVGFERAGALREHKIGAIVESPVTRAHKVESPLGNLFVDLMREAVPGSDAALTNGGSLRTDLPPGELTYGNLHQAMPFDNLLVSVRLNGAELRRAFERHLSSDQQGIISISGLRVEAHCTGSKLEVAIVRPNGKPVGDAEQLSIATSDYLAFGGDGFFSGIVSDDRVTIKPELLRDALARGLAHRQHVRGDDRSIYDPKSPRLALPSLRPVSCRG